MIARGIRRNCFRRWQRRSDAGQIRGRQISRQGRQPDLQGRADGTVDWYTYSGYRRYHSECHVCHGPTAMGSTYAPALKNSLKTMSYGDFLGVVASGRKNVGTRRRTSCRRSATIRTSPATWTISTSICARAPTTRSAACTAGQARRKPPACDKAEDCLHGQARALRRRTAM
jgi:hypothetical protein